MIELFLIAFVWLLLPIPWIIILMHIAVFKNKWHKENVRVIIYILSGFAWIIAGYLAILSYNYLFSAKFSGIVFVISGLLILLFCLWIELMTTKALGKNRIFGSSEFEKSKDKLIISGIYQYARHPRYVEHPLLFVGLGFVFGYKFLFWFAFYLFVSFAISSYFEEKELTKRYGKKYLEYKKKTPAFFIPTHFYSSKS
jgi:protein-S-isoprenylcysteine O-methyltransferase Ste14